MVVSCLLSEALEEVLEEVHRGEERASKICVCRVGQTVPTGHMVADTSEKRRGKSKTKGKAKAKKPLILQSTVSLKVNYHGCNQSQ